MSHVFKDLFGSIQFRLQTISSGLERSIYGGDGPMRRRVVKCAGLAI